MSFNLFFLLVKIYEVQFTKSGTHGSTRFTCYMDDIHTPPGRAVTGLQSPDIAHGMFSTQFTYNVGTTTDIKTRSKITLAPQESEPCDTP